MQKVKYQLNKTKNKTKQERFEERRLQAFRHFMSAHFEEIYYGDSIDDLLIKQVVN